MYRYIFNFMYPRPSNQHRRRKVNLAALWTCR